MINTPIDPYDSYDCEPANWRNSLRDIINDQTDVTNALKEENEYLIARMKHVEEHLFIISRDRSYEDRYPELKKAYEEYKRVLEKYKVFEALKTNE